MSFCVRFKVRTFGNKHPDGSNVRIFFGSGHNITCAYTCVLIESSLEKNIHNQELLSLALFSVDVTQRRNAMQFRKIHFHSQK